MSSAVLIRHNNIDTSLITISVISFLLSLIYDVGFHIGSVRPIYLGIMKCLPLFLPLLALFPGTLAANTAHDCFTAISLGLSYLTFGSIEKGNVTIKSNLCNNDYGIRSLWATAQTYCTAEDIKIFGQKYAANCLRRQKANMTSYKTIAPELTDSYIANMPQVSWDDISYETSTFKMWNSSVLLSQSLYDEAQHTVVCIYIITVTATVTNCYCRMHLLNPILRILDMGKFITQPEEWKMSSNCIQVDSICVLGRHPCFWHSLPTDELDSSKPDFQNNSRCRGFKCSKEGLVVTGILPNATHKDNMGIYCGTDFN